MKIYTKKGDAGETSLVGGQRVGKDDMRVEAYGAVDELTAFVALLRDGMSAEQDERRAELLRILNALMGVEASLAGAEGTVGACDVAWLEERIDAIHGTLAPLTRFTLPGGHPLVSHAHVCRTVCRRAERRAVAAAHEYSIAPDTLAYLNRLSDYFYGLGRALAVELGAEELYWEP